MEIRHRILEFNNSPRYDLLRKELDKLGAAYKTKELGAIGGQASRSVEFSIGESDPLFPVVAELVRKYHFYVQVGVHYSQEDREIAEWVYAVAGEYQYPQPEDDFGYLEATYDTSAHCARCGMGAFQVRPFRLERDFKQSSQFLGLHWVFDEIFVRPEARMIFEREQVSGIEFLHPVYHKSGQDIASVCQMVVLTTARPGLVTEGLSTVTCKADNEESYVEGIGRLKNRLGSYPYCGRVKYHFPRRDTIKFRADVMRELPDVAKSYEYFGSGAGANRLVLARNKVVRLARDHKLRGLRFTPIEVV